MAAGVASNMDWPKKKANGGKMRQENQATGPWARGRWVLAACFGVLCVLLGPIGSSGAYPQSPDVAEFQLPNAAGEPSGITNGTNGSFWFSERNANDIATILPGGQPTIYPLPNREAEPSSIVHGSDGAFWFTEEGASRIGRITEDGSISDFPVAHEARPSQITNGPDGNLWFTESNANKIGRITPDGVVTEFGIPTANSVPKGIVAGPDGALWFTEVLSETNSGQIGRISLSGQIAEFPLPPTAAHPTSIAVGPDNQLWFSGGGEQEIGRITTSGEITTVGIPGSSNVANEITSGPDGNLWVTMQSGFRSPRAGALGRVSPAGQITIFPIPHEPNGLVVGGDGKIWFTAKGGILGNLPPGALGIEVTSPSATISADKATVNLACAGGEEGDRCRGILTFSIQAGTHKKGQRSKRKIVVAKGRYSVRTESKPQRLAVQLRPKTIQLVRRQKKQGVLVTATVANGQDASRQLASRFRAKPRR